MHKVYVPLFISIHSDKTIVTPHEAYDETNDTWNHNKSDINYKAGVARYVKTMKSYYSYIIWGSSPLKSKFSKSTKVWGIITSRKQKKLRRSWRKTRRSIDKEDLSMKGRRQQLQEESHYFVSFMPFVILVWWSY